MIFRRGDVVLVWYPFSSGSGGKRWPCLVVQNDLDNVRLSNLIVAQIITNLRAAKEPTHFLMAANSPDGQQAGLLHDSLISCNNLATIETSLIAKVIGAMSPANMATVDDCLKAALLLP